MEKYILARSVDDVKDYLNGADVVSFDFETAPNDEYRDEPMAAIDPNKSHIVGVSFSVKEGTGIYAPIAHKKTKLNLDMFEILRGFAESKVIKIAHNLAFEAMFMHSNNILIGIRFPANGSALNVALMFVKQL